MKEHGEQVTSFSAQNTILMGGEPIPENKLVGYPTVVDSKLLQFIANFYANNISNIKYNCNTLFRENQYLV